MKEILPDLNILQIESLSKMLLNLPVTSLLDISNGQSRLQLYPSNVRFKCNTITQNIFVFVPAQIVSCKNPSFRSNLFFILISIIPLPKNWGMFSYCPASWPGNYYNVMVVNQLVRIPGVYFSSETFKGSKIFCAKIYSDSVSNFKIEINMNAKKFTLDVAGRKIPLFSFLLAIGLTRKKVLKSLKRVGFFLNELQNKSTLQSLSLLGFLLNTKSVLGTRSFLKSTFFNEKNFSFGPLGRVRFTKKVKLLTLIKGNGIHPEDILAIVNYLINLEVGVGTFDDIDSLNNKKILCSGDFLTQSIKKGFVCARPRIEKVFAKSVNFLSFTKGHIFHKRVSNICKSEVRRSLDDFFLTDSVSQYLDQINSLSEISHKRKIYFLSGRSSKRPSMKAREIHHSQYGRICPIETPDGQKVGIVGALSSYTRVTSDGLLKSPFFKVKCTQKINKAEVFFLSSKQEENLSISFSGDFNIEKKYSTAKINQDFLKLKPKRINFVSVSPIQMTSIATSLIPFLEHDDGNRALMAAHMSEQALPLLNPTRPIVGTGLEKLVARCSDSVVIAKESGVIVSVSKEQIKVNTSRSFNKIRGIENKNFWSKFSQKLEYRSLILDSFSVNHLFESKRIFKGLSVDFVDKKLSCNLNLIKFNNKHIQANDTNIYSLKAVDKSNQGLAILQTPIVSAGEWIKQGEILADNSTTQKGDLSLGKNLLVAYMPWYGYNFEDAIVISERLITENLFTSLHIKRFKKTFDSKSFYDSDRLKNYFFFSSLDSKGVIKVGSWVSEGSVLVSRQLELQHQQQLGLLICDIFGMKSKIKDISWRVPTGIFGRIVSIIFDDITNSFLVDIAIRRQIELGDKISGRHGNKGIVSKILPVQDMPYTQDGSPIDIVLNPLGVPSRMNIGQLLECSLGLAGFNLKENYRLLPFDEVFGSNLSEKIVFNKLYEARLKTNKKWLFNPSSPGKSCIFDGCSGETFKQSITVGYSYFMKLNHLVTEKMVARSTGRYTALTQQPIRGKDGSNYGGQRLGEMEVWALEGFGAAYNLQELLTTKSGGKFKSFTSIVENPNLSYFYSDKLPESFKLLVFFLKSLCLDLTLIN